MPSSKLSDLIKQHPVGWLQAHSQSEVRVTDIAPTLQALDRAEMAWGVSPLTTLFRTLLQERGVSIYDRTLEHHFTGSAIVIDPATLRVLMTFHPQYKIWQQLGGHNEGENDPVTVAAREAWEESGIDDLWMCDWPVRIDPHPAEKCKSVKSPHHNWHYDICYMGIALDPDFKISEESVDMRWFSLPEIEALIKKDEAQQRALEMAKNSLLLFDTLLACNKMPPNFKV